MYGAAKADLRRKMGTSEWDGQMGIAAAHSYLLIVGENGRESSTPFWAAGFAILADAPLARFAIQADAPLAHVVGFASFGRSL
jgi:hypothetical protein